MSAAPTPDPGDADLPSALEVWAAYVERTETAAHRARLEAPLSDELLAWGRLAERRTTRSVRDELRAEVARYCPDPIEKELQLMLTAAHTDEAAALAALIEAAATPGGTPPPREALVALALATASPWAGERTTVRDRPKRPAPAEREFLQWVDRHLPPAAADATPTAADRGPLAFAAHHRLWVPLEALRKAPRWVLDQALAGGAVARPPKAPTLAGDGRLLALAVLVDGIAPARRADPGVRMAATVLVEWFAGPRAALPQSALVLECPQLRWSHPDQRTWMAAFHDAHEPRALATGEHVAGVTAAVMNLTRTVSPAWTPPPPTAEQQEAAAVREDNARRRELARQMVVGA